MKNENKSIVSHLKRYGFINQSAEIYNGFAKSWDFGTNGAEVKRKLKNLWWEYFITTSPYNFPCETSILTPEEVLEASGHKKNFNDWVVECENCKKKIRLDNLIPENQFLSFLELSEEDKNKYQPNQQCQCNGKFSSPWKFNLMLKTSINSSEGVRREHTVYLRPETCQGIFINFLSIKNSLNKKLPFGIGQVGKSFRNEITLNHGMFRTREFEQAELEFFVIDKKEEWWNYWVERSWNFLNNLLTKSKGFTDKKKIASEELPHYSLKTLDLYYKYSFGWGELCSMSDRGSYDLKNHSEKSGHFLGISDEKNEKQIPHVVEVSFGIERMMLAILENSYHEEIVEDSQLKRSILKLNPLLSPYFASVMPLSKQLNKEAYEIYIHLLKNSCLSISYEETGNIGNRYRRQDAIGTPFCITVDFETKNDQKLTIRERDSMKQERILIKEINDYLNKKFSLRREEFLK